MLFYHLVIYGNQMVSATQKNALKKIYSTYFEDCDDEASNAFLEDVYKLVSSTLNNNKAKVADAAPAKSKKTNEPKEPKMYGVFCSLTTELSKDHSKADCIVTVSENWGKTASGKSIWNERKQEFGIEEGQEIQYVEMVTKIYDVIGNNHAARANGILWGLLSNEDRIRVADTFSSKAKKVGVKEKAPVVAQLYSADSDLYKGIKVKLADHFSAASKSKSSFEEDVKYKSAGIIYGKSWLVGDLMEKTKELNSNTFTGQAIWWGLLDQQTRAQVVAAYSQFRSQDSDEVNDDE